jgi:hypothetical protein
VVHQDRRGPSATYLTLAKPLSECDLDERESRLLTRNTCRRNQ